MQRFAQQWLILTLTGSAFFLGLNTFLGELPLLLFTLIGGVIADRHDRRHLLIASQSVQMICAVTLTTLVFLDAVQIHDILGLSFVAGVAQAFGAPAFQSMIPSLVPRSTLPNAVAVNSIQFNLAQLVGPLIGGVVLASLGMVACFGLNGLSVSRRHRRSRFHAPSGASSQHTPAHHGRVEGWTVVRPERKSPTFAHRRGRGHDDTRASATLFSPGLFRRCDASELDDGGTRRWPRLRAHSPWRGLVSFRKWA